MSLKNPFSFPLLWLGFALAILSAGFWFFWSLSSPVPNDATVIILGKTFRSSLHHSSIPLRWTDPLFVFLFCLLCGALIHYYFQLWETHVVFNELSPTPWYAGIRGGFLFGLVAFIASIIFVSLLKLPVGSIIVFASLVAFAFGFFVSLVFFVAQGFFEALGIFMGSSFLSLFLIGIPSGFIQSVTYLFLFGILCAILFGTWALFKNLFP